MRKLIGIFVVLFITTGVFGQKFIRKHSFIEPTPTANNTIEDWIRKGDNGNYEWIDYVHFIQNDRLYLLSYEPKEDYEVSGYRDIYLYSKDINDITSPWEIASEVVMRNHWGDHMNHDEVDFFVYDENQHNTSVGKVVMKEDCVEITIGWESFSNGRETIREAITIIFVPVGNNQYAQRQW